eukprot:3869568-Lingulodinium_polyedra.AAC.1
MPQIATKANATHASNSNESSLAQALSYMNAAFCGLSDTHARLAWERSFPFPHNEQVHISQYIGHAGPAAAVPAT